MNRVARAGRKTTAWLTGVALVAGLAPVAAFAPSALGQALGGISGNMITTGLKSSYPADWQRLSNSLATLDLFNSTQEPVTADISVSLVRDGAVVATTPDVQRQYSAAPSFTVTTPQMTQWQTMRFTGKVGEAVDLTGRLPDGVYTICMEIKNVVGMNSGAQYTGFSQCSNFIVFYPKPPTLVAPIDGSTVASPSPVFQWQPILSNLGGRLPHFFRLVEILPGQTPERAIEANRAIYEQAYGLGMPGGDISSFSYPASAPVLAKGHRYAWRIQVVFGLTTGQSSGGISYIGPRAGGGSLIPSTVRSIGENEGRSKVFTFTWNPDPAAAAKQPAAGEGKPADDEFRMGNVWSPSDPGINRYSDGGGARFSEGSERDPYSESRRLVAPNGPWGDGAASGGNFADRLARVMASLWKQGPGAAVHVARGDRAESDPRISSGARSNTDPRLASAPSGTVKSGTTPTPPPPPAPDTQTAVETPADAAAAVDTTAQAGVTTPAPMPGSPSTEPSGWGPDWARLHGTASLSGEAYSRDGSGSATRPDRSSRVVTGLSVGVIKDQMRIPISALVSDDQVSFRQNINQVAVAPRFRWAGLTAGNFSPQFSSYTLADATILGGGLDLAPKNWHLGFVSGRARKAITPTLDGIVTPQFERMMTAGRIGYGNPLANNVEFSILHATDDAGSIAGADTLTITPEGNTVYSVKAQGVLPARYVRATVETALSRYDRDRNANADAVDGRAIGIQLARETPMTRVGIKAEYLNGGFTTLGNSGVTGDRADVELNTGIQLLQGKLMLNGTVGARNDAVSQALAAETQRRSAGLTGSWSPNPHFGADAQWSVYSSESSASDSLFLGNSNTTRCYSLSPRTAWTVGRVQNSLSVSATTQNSANGGAIADTKSLSLLGNYAAQVEGPLSVTFSGSYTKTDFEIAVTELSAFGPGFTYSAFHSKLVTNAQLQVMKSRTGNAGTDTDFTPRGEIRWMFASHQAIILRGNYRRYQFANPTVEEFNERTASLEYVTNL